MTTATEIQKQIMTETAELREKIQRIEILSLANLNNHDIMHNLIQGIRARQMTCQNAAYWLAVVQLSASIITQHQNSLLDAAQRLSAILDTPPMGGG